MLHHLLNIDSLEVLDSHPVNPVSRRGFVDSSAIYCSSPCIHYVYSYLICSMFEQRAQVVAQVVG